MFKRVLLSLTIAAASLFATQTSADVWVRGYYRSNGTYVQPHYRSNPDGNFYNNWSTRPNVNPYTGRVGTRRTPSYGSYNSYRRYSTPSRSYWNR